MLYCIGNFLCREGGSSSFRNKGWVMFDQNPCLLRFPSDVTVIFDRAFKISCILIRLFGSSLWYLSMIPIIRPKNTVIRNLHIQKKVKIETHCWSFASVGLSVHLYIRFSPGRIALQKILKFKMKVKQLLGKTLTIWEAIFFWYFF